MVGEIVLEAGRTYAVTVEFCNKPADNLVFAGVRVGIGRPLDDADIAEVARVAAAADVAGTTVSVTVTNTGAREGATVVQIYVGDTEASVARPVKELKGFAKVRLAAGESRRVTIALAARAFAFFDVAAQGWRIEAGQFDISVGFSAADLRAVASVTLPGQMLPL